MRDGSGEETDGSGEETDESGEVDDGSGEDEARSRVRVRDCASAGQLFQRPDPTVRWERGRRSDGSNEETDGSSEVDDGSGEDEVRSRVRVRD